LAKSEPKLDWNTAKVNHGKLTVDLDATPETGWKASFERVATLLGSDWDEVVVKKRKVSVQGVLEGREEKLRHFLESVVEQANADHREADGSSSVKDPATEEDHGDPGGDDDPDGRMTERFRAFSQDAA
jgi:hypothetical protein